MWTNFIGKNIHGSICRLLTKSLSIFNAQKSMSSQILCCALERPINIRNPTKHGRKGLSELSLSELSLKNCRDYDGVNPGFTRLPLCGEVTDLLSRLGEAPETFAVQPHVGPICGRTLGTMLALCCPTHPQLQSTQFLPICFRVLLLERLGLPLPVTEAHFMFTLKMSATSRSWHRTCRASQLAVDITLQSALGSSGEPRPHAADVEGAVLVQARIDKETTYPELVASTRCLLVVVAIETGGRWSDEAVQFVRQLAQAKALPVSWPTKWHLRGSLRFFFCSVVGGTDDVRILVPWVVKCQPPPRFSCTTPVRACGATDHKPSHVISFSKKTKR